MAKQSKTKKTAKTRRVDIYPNRVLFLVVLISVLCLTLFALLALS